MQIDELKKIIEEELDFDYIDMFIDERSKAFFYIKYHGQNYMIFVKREYEPEILPLIRTFDTRFPELPQFHQETEQLILFSLPAGKLKRITEERFTAELTAKFYGLQEKLNTMTAPTEYNWDWVINFFFLTEQGNMMYIDLESFWKGTGEWTLLAPKPYEDLSLKERVLLKIRMQQESQS